MEALLGWQDADRRNYRQFRVLDEWEDRYRYLIDLGRELEPLTDGDTPSHKVRGCASQVWLITETQGQGPEAVLKFRGEATRSSFAG